MLFIICLFPDGGISKAFPLGDNGGIPILVYHRFGPQVADSMTVTTPAFEAHLKYIQNNGYKVIPLGELLDRNRKGFTSHSRLVVMTADDGHISIYTDALPLIKKYRIPMTLFIYPSAISNASYAMTWEHLRELQQTGLFDFQSHTYWHPNFKKEKQRLPPAEFERLVDMQLKKSRERLEKELNTKIHLLAWPFGIHDPWLMTKAAEAGYEAAFTIERRCAGPEDHRMAIPRFLMTHADQGKVFEKILNGFKSAGR
jgi:peptidoglycan/xylan/chitin deacetylase (PgdA/CDA1 family)